jgi:F-type H+-transporting ATPase subunit b|uniref:ATP synthase subunit b', chloroplastic n=1 Tax=Vaucheria litorea TaxID=109269 RepID=ATPF2_VAULI|nr:ATP synthase CF0 B' subunit [Vaucheria litorea]B7T1R9.1 RecName: Full=ATP synthase subunit b', chloroplastic; AltName: Full=ATP synthase F(0) sector subunit b'; AltName: Full=ATPase subunit II [Vaucheria litorea]ACF70885.1 ATP synthase CF0 subunit II [Vaucheria litorea]
MLKFSFLFLTVEKPGGLFDFDGTLPLIAIQFLILMFLLNILLYTPLLKIIDERSEYIANNLQEASIILNKANELSSQYEKEFSKIKKEVELDSLTLQNLHKNILEIEIISSQKIFENYLNQTINNFDSEKEKILTSLDEEINSLSSEIITKIVA